MKTPTLVLAVVLAIPCETHAQLQSTSPKDFLSKEGEGIAQWFGAYSNGRIMMFDGEHRNSSFQIKEVALRLDYTQHYGTTTAARKWTNVTLDVSPCDLTQLSTTFSQNPTATPNRVFGAAVSWPLGSGLPATFPAPWGGATGALRFPFQKPWSYSGKADICLDFDFNGGTISNSAWKTEAFTYQLDGYVTGTNFSLGTPFSLGNGGTGSGPGCADSGQSNIRGFVVPILTTFGPTYLIASKRNMHELRIEVYGTAPSRPVVSAVSLGGSTSGTVFPGVSCNNLYIDPSQPTFYGLLTADSSGITFQSFPLYPYTPAATGARLWFQAAWNDSNTGLLKLSRAAWNSVPRQGRSYARSTVHQPDPTKKKQSGNGPTQDPLWNPILRYAH